MPNHNPDWIKEKPSQMGLLGAISVGVGGMVGGGIFAVLGLAAVLGRGGTPVSFLLAGITALLTAYCFSKLSLFHKSDGGMTTFFNEGYGNNWFSTSLNMLIILSYIVMLSLYATAFGAYAATFFSPENQKVIFHIAVSVAIIVPALLNILESAHFGKALFFIVAVKIAILSFFVVIGFIEFEPQRLALSEWPGIIQLIEAGMLIFVAYEGFELIANTAQEIKTPQKNIPRAFFIAVIFVMVLYILVSMCTVGSLPISIISRSQEYVLAEAARPALGHPGFVLITIAALLSTFSAIKSTFFGTTRITARISEAAQLPRIISRRFSGRPLISLFAMAAITLIIANIVDLRQISIMGSVGFLTLFFFINLISCIHHRKITSSLWISAIASLFALASLVILLGHTVRSDLIDCIPVACQYGFSLLYGLLYATFRSRN